MHWYAQSHSTKLIANGKTEQEARHNLKKRMVAARIASSDHLTMITVYGKPCYNPYNEEQYVT